MNPLPQHLSFTCIYRLSANNTRILASPFLNTFWFPDQLSFRFGLFSVTLVSPSTFHFVLPYALFSSLLSCPHGYYCVATAYLSLLVYILPALCFYHNRCNFCVIIYRKSIAQMENIQATVVSRSSCRFACLLRIWPFRLVVLLAFSSHMCGRP